MAQNCVKCGSQEFYEEDGFQYCFYCQTQSQGFAKEIEDDEFATEIQHKEIRIIKNKDGKKKSKTDENDEDNDDKEKRGIRSSWSTFEAYNKIYIKLINDFFKIIESNGLSIPIEMKKRFKSVSMQLWFKYLRESEIAFTVNEHLKPKIKLHPNATYRDNFLISNLNQDLNINNDDDDVIIPHVKHKKLHQISSIIKNPLDYGKNYHMTSKVVKNNDYYNQNDPEKFNDPRLIMKVKNKRKHNVNCSRKLNNLLLTEKLSSTKLINSNNKSDTFMEFIKNNLINNSDNNNVIELNDNNDNNQELQENYIINDNDYELLKKEQMSSKSKYLDQHVSSFDTMIKIRQKTSPIANDLLDNHKILSLLYITIRLFNFNIYLSDLIRWCTEDNELHYLNLFENFNNDNDNNDEFKNINRYDLIKFINYSYPNYRTLYYVQRNLLIHCNIDLDTIPKANIYKLIKRYLWDLNLPNGLLLLIQYRYDKFIQYSTVEKFINKHTKLIPYYEIIAYAVIVLILCDLFNVNDHNQSNYELFKNTKFMEKLFQWNDWLLYTRIRLNLIKAYRLNIYPLHDNVINLNEMLLKENQMWEFYRNVEIGRRVNLEQNCHKIRFELQDLYEKIIFNEQNHQWKNLYHNQKIKSTFYPLTTITTEIYQQLNNDYFKKILKKKFHQKLITPYMCDEYNFFHRQRNSSFKFTNEHNYSLHVYRNKLPDTVRLLFDIGSYLTSTDIYSFRSLISSAIIFNSKHNINN